MKHVQTVITCKVALNPVSMFIYAQNNKMSYCIPGLEILGMTSRCTLEKNSFETRNTCRKPQRKAEAGGKKLDH